MKEVRQAFFFLLILIVFIVIPCLILIQRQIDGLEQRIQVIEQRLDATDGQVPKDTALPPDNDGTYCFDHGDKGIACSNVLR